MGTVWRHETLFNCQLPSSLMSFSDLNHSGPVKMFHSSWQDNQRKRQQRPKFDGFYLISLNLRVDEAANFTLKAAKLLAASSFWLG